MKPLEEEVGRYSTVLSGEKVPVRAAELEQGKAEILGALTLALRESDQEFVRRLRGLLHEGPSAGEPEAVDQMAGSAPARPAAAAGGRRRG
jgi:hypothetical protein